MDSIRTENSNPYQTLSLSQFVHHSLAQQEEVGANNKNNNVATLEPIEPQTAYGLESLGLKNLGHIYHNLSVSKLIEHALAREEGMLASNGALCVKTGKYTGRSPHDKFIVYEPSSQNEVHWCPQNVPISEDNFNRLYRRVRSYIQGRDLYIFDGYVGADPKHRFGVRIINERASQN